MAGIFNLDLSGIGQAIQSIGQTVTSTVAGVQGKLTPEQQAALDKSLSDAQTEIDKAEASSSNIFVAGWRPFIGWICGFAIGYNFLIIPFGNLILKLARVDFVMPAIDYGQLWTLVTGMLGLGTMRTIEKLQGAASNH